MTGVQTCALPILNGTHRPVIFIWSRDGEPAWRKLTYYFPRQKIYVLDELGDPSVPATTATLWVSNTVAARFTGEAPVSLPIPRDARLVWFTGGMQRTEMSQRMPIRGADGFFYIDLPADAQPLHWGSFTLDPQ